MSAVFRKTGLAIAVLVLVVLALLSILLFSHSGNAWLWNQAVQRLEPLSGELVSGDLLHGWTFSRLQWEDNTLSFTAEQVDLQWQLTQLIHSELPVQLLRVKGATLTLKPAPDTSSLEKTTQETAVSSDTELHIPVNVLVDRIDVQQFSFLSDSVNVKLQSLSTDARLIDSKIQVHNALANHLHVTINETKSNSAPSSNPIELPSVFLPLPVELHQLMLNDALLEVESEQAGIQEPVDQLTLAFQWRRSHVQNIQLRANSPRASASLQGDIDLTAAYPLNARLVGTLKKGIAEGEAGHQLAGELAGEKVGLTAAGDLNLLRLAMTTTDPFNLALKGTVGAIAPDTPFDLNLNWKDIVWPPSQTPSQTADQAPSQFHSSRGTASLSGNLKQYQLTMDTFVQVGHRPTTELTVRARGNLEQLELAPLTVKQPPHEHRASPETQAKTEGLLELTGVLNWQKGIRWQGSAKLDNLNPGPLIPDSSPDLPGQLSGLLKSRFSLEQNQWQVDVPELSIHGSLRSYPITAKGALKASGELKTSGHLPESFRPDQPLPLTANVDDLVLSVGQNQLSVNGQIAEQWSLNARIDARTLDEIYPELAGTLTGHIDLSGTRDRPSIGFNLDSPAIAFRQINIEKLKAEGQLSKTQPASNMLPPRIEWQGQTTINIASLVNNGVNGGLKLEAVSLEARGNEKQHQLSLKTAGEPVSGQLMINGSWKKHQWQGKLSAAKVKTPVDEWVLEKPLHITVNDLQSLQLSDQCWQASPARFCIAASQASREKASARFQLNNYHLEKLAPFYPDGFTWTATLSGEGEVHWDGLSPTAHLSLKTTPGSFTRKEADATEDSTDAIYFNYQQLAAELALNKNDLTADLIFASKQLGTATVQTTVNDVHTSRTLGGNLRLESLKLDFLTPFVPEVASINGVLSANARLAGTLEKPLLYGQLVLDKGQLATRADEVKIRDLVTRLAIKGDHGEISGGMRVGEGDVKLTGHLDWQTMPVTGQITLKGSDLEANVPGLLALKASPDLTLEIGAQQKLTGKIVIPWARIQIKDIPKHAITTSDDVVIITPDDGQEQEARAMSAFTMNVAVVLGNDVHINAYGLKANLGGHLTLLLVPGKSLAANGSIQILNGRYHQLGQDLLIKEGNIIFSGPISSPYLMVDAIRNPDSIEGDVTAGIKVTGTPTHPNIEVYSDPAMSQQQQLSYLLRGRGLENSDDSAVQSMLIGLGVSQLGGVVSTVGEAFGLSDVSLDTKGSGDETQVTIGGNLAPGLRVQYGAGVFSSIAEIKIRYELMPHLYLQAVSGLAQAVDLFYQFKISGTPAYWEN